MFAGLDNVLGIVRRELCEIWQRSPVDTLLCMQQPEGQIQAAAEQWAGRRAWVFTGMEGV
jgi:hypothetical protein